MHLIGFAESNYLPSAFDNEVLSDGFCQRPRGSESHGCRHSAPRPEGTGAPRHPQPRSPCQDPHSPRGRWGGGCPWLLGSAPALQDPLLLGRVQEPTWCLWPNGGQGLHPPSCCLPAPAASPHPCSASPSPAPSPGAVGPAEALGPWLPTPAAAALPLVTAGPSCPPPGHPGSCSQAPWQKVCAARAATPAPHPSPRPSVPAPIP